MTRNKKKVSDLNLTPGGIKKVANPFDWGKTEKHLETLQHIKEKREYLIKQKAAYNLQDGVFNWDLPPTYADKCDIKLKELNDIAALQTTPAQTVAKPQLGKYSNSQIVLIFYYFFKFNGLEPRVSIDVAPIAKFIHLVTGRDFTGITNSDFYNRLRTVPNFKTDKELINDLEAIKPLFKMVQLNDAVKMIDNELDVARNEVKQQKKTNKI